MAQMVDVDGRSGGGACKNECHFSVEHQKLSTTSIISYSIVEILCMMYFICATCKMVYFVFSDLYSSERFTSLYVVNYD